jgi:ketosteroid isomerase-like protein
MSCTVETQILEAEERLRGAMLRSDVSTLDKLLSPELIFTSHLGQVVGKQDDLAIHRSGVLKFKELTPSERQIRYHGDVAIVSVRMHLSGSYEGTEFEGDFRYTRIWAVSSEGTWQIIAGQATAMA